MNQALCRAARRAGCTARQAEVLATYVDSETIEDAAHELGVTPRTVSRHLAAARRQMKAAHIPGLIAKVATPVNFGQFTEGTGHPQLR